MTPLGIWRFFKPEEIPDFSLENSDENTQLPMGVGNVVITNPDKKFLVKKGDLIFVLMEKNSQ